MISQYVKIGDLTNDEVQSVQLDSEPTLPASNSEPLPSFPMDELDDSYNMASRLTDEEEDALLKVGRDIIRCGVISSIDC